MSTVTPRLVVDAGAAPTQPLTAAPPRLGAPPSVRDTTTCSRYAIACRASARVLELEGHPGEARRLRELAAAHDPHTDITPEGVPA
ncbi:hypothetical protein GJV82_18225 [Cellulosimicrobium sp. BIT-GX5]|uniref:Uncharacterized protein n=1 Tax=Cellulosimicrobium composti TaxID=2672572 RepID=A0A6N7ZN44_9MICO|nr:hypothetical protein [Cellulosimicrobium composti]MTG90857.1 hypothetical protein [Cellulosimicrobium composti]